ncbi:unnamed protein product [Urochloa decumbens]|uniref:SHSP domain-containing protein n=1 Tax=Urochloa decumbens TaxID=240449 RepID=A0ABC8W9W3_9POAL
MSMLMSSCALLSLAPAPGKFSPAVLQLRTKQPAAPPSAVALPRPAPRYNVSRALRLVCHAHTYDIPPTALVHPSGGEEGKWRISENNERITLYFNVGEETMAGNLEVAVTKDQALLVIKYKGDGKDKSLATKLDARLLMPPGYDSKKVMKAEILRDGWLEIMIAKPKQEPPVPVTKQNTTQGDTGETPPPPAPGTRL